MRGSLTYKDYIVLYKKKNIFSEYFDNNQIQPSSIDLSLSEECYEIKYSFLSPQSKVRDKLQKLIIKKINLNKNYIFKKNKSYLVKLNERLNLNKNIFGQV